ncbi:putative eukaryotic release factor eRF1 [Bodo saltans virus]|uniref:Eukaryotic release factor eRF1 n=1 Tax=Bodo saltans virus TaxID=2024608 RepID=A0A2H4UUE7_9VIRU|nr:putative eukaryotic release factor eRF1 [Bodo saltans virus]ATZ80563.1 putative eukaryotic release factor eRF1 [Bodo saltans virus]
MRILDLIEYNFDNITKANTKGIFIFCGIDEYDDEIFYTMEPNLISKMFYYNCGSKFITDIMIPYFEEYSGTIIFVNGEICIIYKYTDGHFEICNSFKSMICEKHKKGGQSSVRFGRIADNIREKFIITIIEHINKLGKKSNWIFGSKDIIDDVYERKNTISVELLNGGFIEFDKTTINDTQKWIQYIKNINTDDDIIEQIATSIDKGENNLNFELDMIDNIDVYEFIILCPNFPDIDKIEETNKIIKLKMSSKFYGKLKDFVCIGKLYY